MKRMILSFVLVLFLMTAALSQNIPNREFENWSTHPLYEEPVSWLTSNAMPVLMDDSLVLVVRKTEDAVSGSYGLYLENKISGDDTIPGFAICEGSVGGDYPHLDFIGGFPYTEQPDSLTGDFKYDIEPGDTAWVIVVFKKAGAVLAENWFRLYGSQADYKRLSFPLEDLTEAPDTVWLALTAGSPWGPVSGSYLYADHLSFDKGDQAIPNGDFEDWSLLTYDDPDGWYSGNLFSAVTHSDRMCSSSTDAHSGNYALRLETVKLNILDDNAGVVATGKLGVGTFGMGFPVQAAPTVIQGYYKYTPAGDDSAQVVVFCSKWNEETDSRDQSIRAFALPAVADYTFFSDTLHLGEGAEVDTVNLIFSSGWLLGAQHTPPAGSVLYIDDLWLVNACGHADTMQLFTFRDTTFCTGDSIILDAGSGYTSYLWSDSSTTQTITVSDSGVYSVMVTLPDGCTATDAVTVHTDACTGTPHVPDAGDVRVRPNPCGNYFFIDLPATMEGRREIYVCNILGQRVFEKTLATGTTGRLQVDMSGQPAGIYFVRISSAQGSKVLKVVKR